MIRWLLICVVLCFAAFQVQSSYYYDDYVHQPAHQYCVNESSLVYALNNEISIIDTLVVCLQNIGDSLLFPGYRTGKTVNVSTQVTLNNLISVDELSDSVNLDLFFFLEWVDPRLAMPALWEKLSPEDQVNGISLSEALGIQTVNGQQLGIWVSVASV